jgi:hypothetical protein
LTSQGTAHGRFTRAVQQRNLFAAQIALREMREPSLLVALDYLALLADLKPERFPLAAVRWHGRLELETPTLTLPESQFALAALAMLGDGQQEAVELLRTLLRKVRPALVPRMS